MNMKLLTTYYQFSVFLLIYMNFHMVLIVTILFFFSDDRFLETALC